MKAHKIKLLNIMGIDNIEITPGNFTIISGHNAAGKTSIVEGILSVVKGGHDATLLRSGQDKGEIVIELDDETVIQKKISASKSATTVNIGKHSITSPATFIKDLFGDGFNPVRFLTMDPKKRIAEILKAIPFTITHEELKAVTGIDFQDMDFNQHGLKVLDAAVAKAYDKRKEINAYATELKNTIDVLTNPDTVAVDMSEDIKKYRSSIEDIDNTLVEISESMSDIHAKIDADLREAIANLTVEANEKKRQATESYNARKDSLLIEKAEINKEIAIAETKTAEFNAQESQRTKIAESKERYDKYVATSDRLTRTLEILADFRKQKASGFTLAGQAISTDKDDLLVDGIPYDRLNKASQIKIAMALAQQNMGKFRFAIIDGAEALDAESMEFMRQEAEAADIQLIVLEVSDGDLQIKTN
ncbi:MAG TPA: hypothetical protein PKI15_08135 [Candidatus Cloacimonadota bacterium]|nr:hypothetical protein [Candidatus Cloacimonadota bacterium]